MIHYVPHTLMVESKALKLYLFSFRNHGAFHEECTVTIGQDLVALLDPYYLEVQGKFRPRGGISIHPFFVYGKAGTPWEGRAEEALAERARGKRVKGH